MSILTPHTASRRDGAEIVVRVRTLQGEPTPGIPVRFQLDPAWQGAATLVPEQTTTDHGIARARLCAALIGNVRVTVRVSHGTVIRRTGIAFSLPGGGETGAD